MWAAGPPEEEVRKALGRVPDLLRDADTLADADLAEVLKGRAATLAWAVGDADTAPVSLSVKPANLAAATEEYAAAGSASLRRDRAGRYALGALNALSWVLGARSHLQPRVRPVVESVRAVHPPPPGEWHPAIERTPHLEEWLRHGSGILCLPVRPGPRLYADLPAPGDRGVFRQRVLTRRRAWASAPYVGRPFCYTWFVGTDDLGRHITTEATVLYLPRGVRADPALWHAALGPAADGSSGW